MFIFKAIFSMGLLLADAPVMDAEGWVTVERPKKEAEANGADERDPSIWVLFAKQMGVEKFLISFPDEPTYRYMNGNGEEMEVMTTSGGIEHRLQVWNEKFESAEQMLKLRLERLSATAVIEQKSDENSAELLVWKDDFWLHEKIIKTEHHTFFLQTKSPSIERDSHRAFVQSFDLEIHPKF